MKRNRYILLTTVGLLLPLSAHAQYGDESEPGEVSVYTGAHVNTGAHPYVGATAGRANRRDGVNGWMQGDRNIIAIINDRSNVQRDPGLKTLNLGRCDRASAAARSCKNVYRFAGV